jgi:phage gp46-like protein
MTDIFEGDPRLTFDGDGANMVNRGGQPVMDQGLENAALISWFTREGWSGNILMDNEAEKVGSDFEKTANQAMTVSTINAIQGAGERAWQWFIDTGIASTTIVRASNPTFKNVEVVGLIEPVSRDLQILNVIKNGLNWIMQKVNPAHRRL